MKKNGFTLIEIIAVVIILGVLMILAVPAVSNLISDSRGSTYITDANSFVLSAKNIMSAKNLYIGQDSNTTYYIPYTCVKDELEHKSPYGQWDKVYVVITYDEDEEKYNYYYTSNDKSNMGIYLSYEELLKQDILYSDVKEIYTGVTIGNRERILLVKDDCDINNAELITPMCNIPNKGRLTIDTLEKCLIGEYSLGDDDVIVKVTYDSGTTGEGSCNETIDLVLGKPYGNLCTPTKEGNIFVGWYTTLNDEVNEQGEVINKGLKINSDTKVTNSEPHTLYARWGGEKYTVTFDTNGGEGCDKMTVTYGLPYGNLCSPTKAGRVFVGWYLDKDLTNGITDQTMVDTPRNHTLYAKYGEIGDLIIRYDSKGGTSCAQMTKKYDEEYGTLCTTTRTGYTFVNWFTAETGGTVATDKTRATGNITLYARWKANNYSLTFHGNGATSGSTVTNTCTYDENCTLNENGFIKTGYGFQGWSRSSNGAVVYPDSSTSKTLMSNGYYSFTQVVRNVLPSGNLDLYAIWKANPYKVVFYGNGNTGGSTGAINCTYDQDCQFPANGFTKTGYTFAGWATSSGGAVAYANSYKGRNLTTQYNGVVNLYAKWTPNTYTITFNGNGATGGSTATKTCTYDQNCTFTSNGYTRTNYEFLGWATSASGSTVYNNGHTVKNLATGGNVNLYASWKLLLVYKCRYRTRAWNEWCCAEGPCDYFSSYGWCHQYTCGRWCTGWGDWGGWSEYSTAYVDLTNTDGREVQCDWLEP